MTTSSVYRRMRPYSREFRGRSYRITSFCIYLERDDLDRSTSPIFYEKPGIPKLEDDDNDGSLDDVRRVRFSTAPIRVSGKKSD